MDNKLKKIMAKVLADALKTKLHIEANSTSSTFIYQPKAPKDLLRFREKK